MTSRILRSTLIVLLVSSFAAVRAEETKKCNATAQECEREIRRMLSGRRYLGLQVVELAHGGIVVKEVNKDSPAEREFRKGDRIIAVNGHDMTLATVKEFKQTLTDAAATGGALFVIVQRRGNYQKLDAQLQQYPKDQIDKIIAQHLLQYHQVQSQTSSAHP